MASRTPRSQKTKNNFDLFRDASTNRKFPEFEPNLFLDTSQTSQNSQTSNLEDDQLRLGYSYDQLKDFLSKSTLKNKFPFVQTSSQARQLLAGFTQALSSDCLLHLDELCDLYALSIIMMTYERENLQLMQERFNLLDATCDLAHNLEPEEIDFMARGLYEKFVHGCGKERMERVIDMQESIPALIVASSPASDIALTLLFIILIKYIDKPTQLKNTKNATNAFEMVQLIDWQNLVDSGLHADMFMLIRTFGLIINSRRIRQECSDWNDNLGAEIHKYFLQVRKTIDNSATYGVFEMMVERYIAYCVVRGASTNPQLCQIRDPSSVSTKF